MLKAVIFDVDGTLLDTERIYMRAWKEAGKELGYDVTDEVLLKTRAMNAKDASVIFETMIGNGFSYQETRKGRVRIAEEIIEKDSPVLLPGVHETLQWLKEKGIRLAVASSTGKEKTVAHLKLNGLDGYFEVIVGGDMITNGKPAPDIFLKAAELLGEDPSVCAVCEDSISGIRAAHAAGMKAIQIPDTVPATEETRRLSHAVVEHLDGCIPVFEKLMEE